MSKWFEDFKVGEKHTTRARTVTEGEIHMMLGIGRYIDPFMIDEEYAKTTVFQGRVAPGRLTVFLMGGMISLSDMFDHENVIANMGFNAIRFKSPLKAGDTIRLEMEVIELRETSKPDRGLVFHRDTCLNQRGEAIVEEDNIHMVKRRPQYGETQSPLPPSDLPPLEGLL